MYKLQAAVDNRRRRPIDNRPQDTILPHVPQSEDLLRAANKSRCCRTRQSQWPSHSMREQRTGHQWFPRNSRKDP